MDRQAEIEVIAATLIVLADADKQANGHEPENVWIRKRTIDFLADTFRKGGVDPHAPNLGHLALCSECNRVLDIDKGERFIGSDGEDFCGDHWPDRDVDEDLELAQESAEHAQILELDRKLRQRPERS